MARAGRRRSPTSCRTGATSRPAGTSGAERGSGGRRLAPGLSVALTDDLALQPRHLVLAVDLVPLRHALHHPAIAQVTECPFLRRLPPALPLRHRLPRPPSGSRGRRAAVPPRHGACAPRTRQVTKRDT